MSDLNVIEVTPKPKSMYAVQMTRANARAIHEDDRFVTAWIDDGLLRVITLKGSRYLRPGMWIVFVSPEHDNRVYWDEEFRREYDGVPENYDADQRVLF
jgi:hypothetical protein